MEHPKMFIELLARAKCEISERFGKIVRTKKLKGLSNYNYRVEYLDIITGVPGCVVLKLLNLNSITERTNDPALLTLLAERGIAPKTLVNKFPDYYVLEYLPGIVPSKAEFKNAQLLSTFINLLHETHTLHYPSSTITIDFTDSAKALLAEVPDRRPEKALLEELLLSYTHAFKKLPPSFYFCHNDLNKENIILVNSKRFYLIDFEYSGLSDIFFDLTSLAQLMPDTKYKKVLTFYQNGLLKNLPISVFNEKLKLVRDLGLITTTIWYLSMSYKTTSQPTKVYNEMFKDLFKKINRGLNKL